MQSFKNLLLLIGLVFVTNVLRSQKLIDNDRAIPYQRVFIETDDFDSGYLDELEAKYKTIKIDSFRYAALNDLAYYMHTRDLKRSLELTREGLELVRADGNELWEGRFQITEGAILLRMEKLDTARQILLDAEPKVKKQDLPLLYTQLGYIYEREGNILMAADFAFKCKNIGTDLNDNKAIAQAYSDLSNLYWKFSDFEKGLELSLTSVSYFEERNLKDMDYDFVLYVVGNNLMNLQKYEEALFYFKRAIDMGEQYGFYNNLSDIYISLVDLYTELNQFELAENAGEQAVKYANLIDNDFLLMRSWSSIGRLKLFQGKYQESIELLNLSKEVATPEFGDKFFLSQLYRRLGRAYHESHNYQNSINAFEVYDSLKKEVLNDHAKKRMSLLKYEFDLEDKESMILGMEERIKKQRSTQSLIIIIAGLLLILLLVLYVTYQNNKKKNILLENQNEEKEFLLKEIHHRVKNNLGIVSSLLELQADKIKDQKIISAIEESRNRVYSMSMIHQKLYQGTNLSSIGMKEYLIDLSRHILDSYGSDDRVEYTYELEEMNLDVDAAIPIGLIVNELLTNSLKHAFPEDRKGVIHITCRHLNKDRILLEVADNGIGLIEFDKEDDEGSGFGTQLIDLLIHQLDGSIMTMSGEGTKIRMEFDID
ncbi:tetratricopeptide repeat-containing sensor histidine kinase [Lutimonas sp.]|uniref:tetratricopeptide repeat-containing sensor histidine kinase n=1 Tax=Lutimonas sp. TaxID=1872403 RepID=UPI003D9BCDE0